ncbi:MAG: hypothetical protein VKJ64_08915 [Leptolyngbyaceae bacterium]|nr:hypothetical protein [Leptolyngbyaceae bacterium]
MVIVDSGFWLALANKRDTFHQQATACFPKFRPEGLITTWCVIVETCYLLQQRVGVDAPAILLNL